MGLLCVANTAALLASARSFAFGPVKLGGSVSSTVRYAEESLEDVEVMDGARFDGTSRLYGDSSRAVLREARVVVVGVGGVGSWQRPTTVAICNSVGV